MTEAQEVKLDKIYDEVRELITVLKGFNGYPGLLKEFATLKTDFWSYVDNRSSSCPFIQESQEIKKEIRDTLEKHMVTTEGKIKDLVNCIEPMEKEVDALKNKAGKTALKWLNRIGVALISAAAVWFLAMWMDSRNVIIKYVKDNSTSQSAPVVP